MGVFAQRHYSASLSKVSQLKGAFSNFFRIDFLSTDTKKLLSQIKDSERADFSFAMPELNTTAKKKAKKRNMVNFDNIEEPAFDDFVLNERQMNQFTTNLREITINEDHFGIHVQDSDFLAWVAIYILSVAYVGYQNF